MPARGSGYGRYVFGAGIIFIAALMLAWGTFDPGQPVPKGFPGRTELAYLAGAFMLVVGLAIEWRRTAAWAAAALAIYYILVVIILMNGRIVLAHYAVYGIYEGLAEQIAIAAGALIVYASTSKLDARRAARLMRIGQIAFGICAIVFGGAHFKYMNLTAPLVPKWLPPNQLFWGYATGAFHIAAGLAILSGIQARLAAILLTIMYALFTPLVHLPMLIGNPSNHFFWTENAANLVLTGAAWVVADSLAQRGRFEAHTF
ncbi:MAG TPA: hypothetical protein VGM17_06535 [Rhizomicrobium sp.]|jgi:uncharacterized membrane protein